MHTPIHPGEILADELEEIGLNAVQFAKLIDVPSNYIDKILSGERNINTEMALRFSRYFGTSVDFWENLQKLYEQDKTA